IFMLVTFSLVKETISSQIDSYQKSLVRSSVKAAEHYILTCQKPLSSLGKDRNFQAAVSRGRRAELSRIMERIYTKYKNFNFVGVAVRRGGNLTMSAVYPRGKYAAILNDEEINDYMEMNFRNPKFRTSPVLEYRDGREVIITQPLKGAVVVGGVNIGQLSSLLDKTKPEPESEFLVLDSRNNLITGRQPEESYIPPDSNETSRAFYAESVIYYEPFPLIEGWLALSTPREVVYRSLGYLTRILAVFIVLSVAGAFGLALYFSKKVTVPVENLNRGARILGAGNLDYRIDLNTGDELEELADEFNRMSEKLKESYDSMGDKIRIATRDLQDAYSQIEEKNQQLKKADKLKSEFLASMSHELRTPINAIIGFTSLMQEGTYGELTQKQKETLEKVIRNTNNLLHLINDILDLSKIESGRMSLHSEELKVNRLLRELYEELKPLAAEKDFDFNLETGEEIKCTNDYTRLKQIVTNLVSNAIKFTSGGEVIIKSETAEDGFIIEITDTGIGIKKEQLSSIFDEFVQADGSVTREFGGTGLGLSISKKLIDMMGGKIEIESKWGEGSTFRVCLPYEAD
ncbi:MAG: ATP-binding protein, partial [Elusimicrobiota bacterium]|nr:ATP-binding protein [Elusimicrobiota bacterium]